MGEVIKFKKKKLKDKHKGKSLCQSGFHKWEIINEKQFEVKSGKLITVLRCKRCAITKSESR